MHTSRQEEAMFVQHRSRCFQRCVCVCVIRLPKQVLPSVETPHANLPMVMVGVQRSEHMFPASRDVWTVPLSSKQTLV